ncbi:MAG: DUF547 domain-containing protein [Planctomycetes bacterium]|nr:DUF547 domain-containing protein [Planctomycetota bacterium]
MRTKFAFAIMLALLPLVGEAGSTKAPGIDHSPYSRVLDQHVEDGWVDYEALKKDPSDLLTYIGRLARAPMEKLGRDEKMATYINAYNAFTLKLITEYDPEIDSIKDIPGGLFSKKRWKDKRWNIGGEIYSLSQIEHKILRKEFEDPRIHFALNCASIGCPVLRGEPYTGEKLDKQLDAAARTYNQSPRGLRLNRKKGVIYVSQIYDWFKKDFLKESDSILDYVAQYAERDVARYIRRHKDKLKIKDIDYDWSLNGLENKPE